MAHQRQIIGAGKSARTAADDGDFFAGGWRAFRLWHIAGGIDGVALEAADVDRFVEHGAAAARFAWMLADIGAGHREWIVLADQAHRVGAAAFANQRDVARNIDAGWAERHAWHWLFHVAEAAMVLDVFDVVVAEAFQAGEHQTRCVGADGTGGCALNDLRGALHDFEVFHFALAAQDAAHQVRKLAETDAAWHAFSAGLRVAEIEEVQHMSIGHSPGPDAMMRRSMSW